MERRKHQRIRYLRRVAARSTNGDAVVMDVLDYSMGGMGLVSRKVFDQGEIIQLDTVMTLDGEQREMDIKAEVRYVKRQFEEYALGIAFV